MYQYIRLYHCCVFCNVYKQKADYCSGVSVSGVQSVKFSLDCVDCENSRAVIQFRVYSESFSEKNTSIIIIYMRCYS